MVRVVGCGGVLCRGGGGGHVILGKPKKFSLRSSFGVCGGVCGLAVWCLCDIREVWCRNISLSVGCVGVYMGRVCNVYGVCIEVGCT